ncbi:hypothetical protein HMPREF1868_01950 [Olsenella sp. DNF00959]|nr:hypothetical protein HMPREF1868_01950 [Olsenella sp. DNF00959]
MAGGDGRPAGEGGVCHVALLLSPGHAGHEWPVSGSNRAVCRAGRAERAQVSRISNSADRILSTCSFANEVSIISNFADLAP